MRTAVQAYRGVLRAARLAFQGDVPTLTAAHQSIRAGFLAKADIEPTGKELRLAIAQADEIATILRQNVVQGKREGDTYKLRIHEEIERGDNDSVKFAGKTLGQGAKCCSS